MSARIQDGNSVSAPDALLLDEMYSPRIAGLLAQRHINCVAVAGDQLLSASDDETVLVAALDQRRVLVTNNVVDFERLRRGRTAVGLSVPELIYTDDSTFPRDRAFVDRIAAALAVAATEHLTAAFGGVLWLSSRT
ncbi:MAG: DUF5615 family PIN-like protein [Jatrophihabitans endophyticus]|nr:DUF5615 family PIN-like protein [Jatrophihabitans endophyticus]